MDGSGLFGSEKKVEIFSVENGQKPKRRLFTDIYTYRITLKNNHMKNVIFNNRWKIQEREITEPFI